MLTLQDTLISNIITDDEVFKTKKRSSYENKDDDRIREETSLFFDSLTRKPHFVQRFNFNSIANNSVSLKQWPY